MYIYKYKSKQAFLSHEPSATRENGATVSPTCSAKPGYSEWHISWVVLMSKKKCIVVTMTVDRHSPE